MFYNIFCAFFAKNIWSCQKYVVPLRQNSEHVLLLTILPAKRTGQLWGETREG